MEIEGEDGTKLLLKAGVKSVFGRGAGFKTEDLSVSRRHVSFELKSAAAGTERSESGRVYFEVLGRNPVWVKTGEPGEKIRALRKSETGEIAGGDRFCVSGHNPIWFTLKKRRDEVMEERALDSESELGVIDISDTDPVKEFGFLVIGKEFDQYPKSRMRDVKQWDWFLEDSTKGNSDDDDGEGDKKGRKGLSKKRSRKKGNEDDDDDWSVESDEDKELIVKSKRVLTPTYSTRSKKKTKKDTSGGSSSSTQTKQRGRVDSEDDDDDETLGGFIVSDEEDKLEEEDESNVEEDLDEDEDEELD
ncbi:PREDICTED: protein bfr2-like [Camelina sativa]|uniref:Protein bfr2-like n=1 Tax=Camelina sativa TaxID=90675 RepID=A0ABM0YI37_CAMSA|nr:PREDICTED: protein bfr2-like [Camelina sativa]XP_010501194.1 PREDICTED: protein bfr2-like [Camelina sativa]